MYSFSNFCLAQLSGDDITNENENTKSAINIALSFVLWKRCLMICHMFPLSPLRTKITLAITAFHHKRALSLSLISMELLQALILTSNSPSKETAAQTYKKYKPILPRSVNISSIKACVYRLTLLQWRCLKGKILKVKWPQRLSALVCSVFPADSTGSLDNMANVKPKTPAAVVTKN